MPISQIILFLEKHPKCHLPKLGCWPLKIGNYEKEILNSHSSIYLTTLSIIQGVSLSFWAYNSYNKFPTVVLSSEGFSLIVYSILTILINIFIFYEYTWSTILYRWIVRLRDIVVLYLLGIGEILLTFLMHKPKYWNIFALLLIITGIYAYINTSTSLNCVYRDDGNGCSDCGGESSSTCSCGINVNECIEHARSSAEKLFILLIIYFIWAIVYSYIEEKIKTNYGYYIVHTLVFISNTYYFYRAFSYSSTFLRKIYEEINTEKL